MYLVTTETIADQKISEVKGAIFNEQVISVNIVKDAISGIKGIFGGKSTTYSEEYSKGRKLALAELEQQAHRLSANAI
ncbi:heavy metal-binding domain-containing protein, partial [Enterococcus faecalis]|nr:heavy metal-binding domain-containing protein [Enterococcus faecalis]